MEFTTDSVKVEIGQIQSINESIWCIWSDIALTDKRIVLIISTIDNHGFRLCSRWDSYFCRELVKVAIAISSYGVVNSIPLFKAALAHARSWDYIFTLSGTPHFHSLECTPFLDSRWTLFNTCKEFLFQVI